MEIKIEIYFDWDDFFFYMHVYGCSLHIYLGCVMIARQLLYLLSLVVYRLDLALSLPASSFHAAFSLCQNTTAIGACNASQVPPDSYSR